MMNPNGRTAYHPLAAAAALLAALGAGCSATSGLNTVPVSGQVTYKGGPVAGATVSFLGAGSERPATAITDSRGTYHLTTLDAKGAMPGNYAVTVTKTELPPELMKPVSMEEAAKAANQPPPKPKELLPVKYGAVAKTPLHVEVKSGQSNKLDLPLAD